MEFTSSDDEDKHMGFADIAEFIKKLNHSNETGDSLESLDGLDNLENGSSEQQLHQHQPPIEETSVIYAISPFLVFATILVVFIMAIVFIYNSTKCLKSLLKCGKNYNKQFNQLLVGDNSTDKRFRINKLSLSKSYETSISSSGSGSGIGLFRKRTLADQIDFITRIELGSFGRVWVCNYRGQAYTCRVYSTLEQNLWQHEADIQSQLSNPDVVGMIAKDIRNDPITCSTRFLIITDYYPNGSLYQFLKSRQIDEITMLNLMYSISRGLYYLHAVILGNPDKPAVIHFNLKSRNIMVANCGSRCLISDFSTACLFNKEHRISESPTFFNPNPETLRYRAPELLTINQVPNNLQLARACDVYSLSLILWEIASRCILPGTNELINNYRNNYQLPYEEELNNQTPNQEIMNQLVNINQVRPKINNKWSTSPTLSKISELLADSWKSSSLSRLTALRIMKSLDNLRESLESKDSQKVNFSSIEIIN